MVESGYDRQDIEYMIIKDSHIFSRQTVCHKLKNDRHYIIMRWK